MEFIEVKFDLERSRQIFKRYLAHERKRAFKKAPIMIVLAVCIALVASGLFFDIIFLTYIGVLLTITLGIFLVFIFLKFQSAFNKFSKKLDNMDQQSDRNFKLGFDSKEIVHQTGKASRKLSWNMINHYEINKQDIYLFLENRQLYDIISASIMGQEKFENFKTMLIEKTTKN